MSIVDSHVHLYPPEVNRDPAGWAAAQREPRFSLLCTRRRKNGTPVQAFPSLDELLRSMDEAGVDRAVLLGWYWETQKSCEAQNRFYAACVRAHPDRLAAFASVNPVGGAGGALAEGRRAHEDGLVGFGELFPAAQGFGPADPGFAEILALAGELRIPVTLHATDPDSRPYPGMLPTPDSDFLRMATEHPATRFILAHWGGMLPVRSAEARSLPNLFFDTAASPLTYDPGVWARFIGKVGADRVLFGSDFPLILYPGEESVPSWKNLLAEVEGSNLGPKALSLLLCKNALRVANWQ